MENFEKSIEKLLHDEGGYVDHPQDPGGKTKYGISQRYYPFLDIKNLTEKEASDIYYKDYWVPSKLSEISCFELADKVFNIGVNIGMKNAIKMLQRATRASTKETLIDDGILGPRSLSVINSIIDKEGIFGTICAFQGHCDAYYRSLKKESFLKGWLNRLYS